MQKIKELQLGLLSTKEENEAQIKRHEEQLSFLPANPLQEKLSTETPTLSAVEYEIMEYTLKGLEIEDIAQKIFRSIAGVKWRLSQVYWKFGVQNRLQLINKAASNGLQFYVMKYIPETKENVKVKQTFHINLDFMAHGKANAQV